MAVTLVAAWPVASQSKEKRGVGFWYFIASNVLWVHSLIAGRQAAANPWGDVNFGNQQAQAFFQEGVDIVIPIAGGTGIGSFTAAKQAQSAGQKVYAIGVDTDQYLSAPGFEKVILTSIQKIIDKAVAAAIKQAQSGVKGGSNYVGTLANGGVNIAPFHDLSTLVPADLQTGLDALRGKIVDGSVKVADYLK